MVLLHDEHLQQPNAAMVAEQLLAATIQTLTSRALSCYFFDSNFIEVSNVSPSIQGHLRQHIPVVRQRRQDSGLLLSAEHMSTLFERAFESAATLYQQPFDPVRSARRDLPVSTDLTGHLVNFMSHLPIGIQGIIPPAILQKIQERLNLPIPVQEFFTLAYGVSAGALIVLALFVNGWPPSTWSLPGVNWIRCILSDALYPEEDIEEALKRAFGETELTEASYAQRIGARIGIPAATIHQPSLCLFTNYNGSGKERTGYRVMTGEASVKTWEVRGRSSSAAPLYFPAKYLRGLGTFQDAGVVANNPIIIALAEFAAISGNSQPDLVLNIGTGTSPDIPLVDRKPQFIRDSWLVRLKRGYMSLMQGRKAWNDVTSIGNKAGRNGGRYRLDLTITEPPSIDDTTSMPMLTSMVYRDAMLFQAVPEIAYHLFATLFYFELDALPQITGSKFGISGHILCTRKGQDAALP
ncbi:patatin phospholipase [Fusarium flagelliforme]|uniref:Patatin phospholipase n=1 Tax=Fusarium flagelliforme TaxID=2675880 RepID=A0A395MVD8_9HYPO|nr:patatin phospholipase [Fusarium flagelliforme]